VFIGRTIPGQPVVSTITGENNHIARKSSLPRALSLGAGHRALSKQPLLASEH
jgi:hypothetical protein